MKKSMLILFTIAVLTFTSVVPVHANTTLVQTKSTMVAGDPVCCCADVQILNHKTHFKTKKIKFKARVVVTA